MLAQIRPAVTLIAIFTLLCGVVFPLAFTGFGAMALPFQSGGSLIMRDGKVIGSAIIGQNFTSEKYFQGRPSALMGADPKDASKQVPTPYDAGESGASNLAPTSKALIDRVTAAVAKFGAAPVQASIPISPLPRLLPRLPASPRRAPCSQLLCRPFSHSMSKARA
jgi:K+-transporting ATPase ATPase C chain